MATFINLKTGRIGSTLSEVNQDILDLIVKNRNFVRHLKKNGIDNIEICHILGDLQGLKMEMLIKTLTEKDKADQRKIDYAMRYLKALVSNEAITDEESDYLCKIQNRLLVEYLPWEKDKKGRLVAHWRMGEGDAKTQKQARGRQVVKLYYYIQEYNTNKDLFLQKDVFELIAELYDVWENLKYTRKEIENFYKNNF